MECLKQIEVGNAQAISLSDLDAYFLAPGNVFYQRQGGRPIKLLQAGQLIDHEKILRFSTVAEKIYIERAVSHGNIHVLVQMMKEFRLASHERDSWQMRQEILMSFVDGYWKELRPAGWLDLAIAGHQAFLRLDQSMMKRLGEMGDDLLVRNSILAMLGVYFSIATGHLATDLLSDVYHAILLKDWGLKDCASSRLINQMEEARLHPEAGDQKLFDHEKRGLREHSEAGLALMQEWPGVFLGSSLPETIRLHHENAQGDGFPQGSNEDEWTDLDGIFSMIESLLPYTPIDFKEGDAKGAIKKLWADQLVQKKIPIRLLMILSKVFDSLPSLQEYYQSQEAA